MQPITESLVREIARGIELDESEPAAPIVIVDRGMSPEVRSLLSDPVRYKRSLAKSFALLD